MIQWQINLMGEVDSKTLTRAAVCSTRHPLDKLGPTLQILSLRLRYQAIDHQGAMISLMNINLVQVKLEIHTLTHYLILCQQSHHQPQETLVHNTRATRWTKTTHINRLQMKAIAMMKVIQIPILLSSMITEKMIVQMRKALTQNMNRARSRWLITVNSSSLKTINNSTDLNISLFKAITTLTTDIITCKIMCQLLSGIRKASQVNQLEVKNMLETTKIEWDNQVHTVIICMLQYSLTKLKQNLRNSSLHLIIRLDNSTSIKMVLLHRCRKIVQLISTWLHHSSHLDRLVAKTQTSQVLLFLVTNQHLSIQALKSSTNSNSNSRALHQTKVLSLLRINLTSQRQVSLFLPLPSISNIRRKLDHHKHTTMNESNSHFKKVTIVFDIL